VCSVNWTCGFRNTRRQCAWLNSFLIIIVLVTAQECRAEILNVMCGVAKLTLQCKKTTLAIYANSPPCVTDKWQQIIPKSRQYPLPHFCNFADCRVIGRANANWTLHVTATTLTSLASSKGWCLPAQNTGLMAGNDRQHSLTEQLMLRRLGVLNWLILVTHTSCPNFVASKNETLSSSCTPLFSVSSSGVPRNFVRGGVQQIQLRTEKMGI